MAGLTIATKSFTHNADCRTGGGGRRAFLLRTCVIIPGRFRENTPEEQLEEEPPQETLNEQNHDQIARFLKVRDHR